MACPSRIEPLAPHSWRSLVPPRAFTPRQEWGAWLEAAGYVALLVLIALACMWQGPWVEVPR